MNAPNFSQAIWHKSSRSNGAGGMCVEVAFASRAVGMRDSKNPGGAVLVFGTNEMAAFLSTLKAENFGPPSI